eukprot:238752_1
MCLLSVFYAVNSSNTAQYVYYIVKIVLAIIIICCLFINSIGYIYMSIIIILIFFIIYCIGTFFLHFFAGGIVLPLLGFGITTKYLFKVIEFRKVKEKSPTIKYSNIANNIEQQPSDIDIVTNSKQIEMETIQKMKWTSQTTSSINTALSDSE